MKKHLHLGRTSNTNQLPLSISYFRVIRYSKYILLYKNTLKNNKINKKTEF